METKSENTEFEKYVNDYTETLRGITDIILKVDLKKELTESEKKQYNKYLKLLNTKKSYDTKVFLDPYRELKKRFNYVLNNDISKLNDNDKIKFYFNLERLKNEIIYYTQTNKLRPQKLDNVVNNIEHIYKVVYSNDFFNSELFQKAKLQKAILNDTYDFDLSHNKKEIVNSDIENRILKVIDKIEAEFKPKGSNKTNKKGAGRKETEAKPLSEYITKKWNADQKKEFIKDLRNEFQSEIINNIENGHYLILNNLIYYIRRYYVKTDNRKALTQSIMNALEIGDKWHKGLQTNTNTYLGKTYPYVNKSKEFNEIEERLKKIKKQNFAYE